MLTDEWRTSSDNEHEPRDRAARTLLRLMFDAAVASADPLKVLPAHLPEPPGGRCVVVGAGKAAAAMALAVERAWPDVPLSGVVAVPYGSAVPCERIRVLEAAHPVPDENSVVAAREVLAAVEGLAADDLVLALISGGGSSTMCLPVSGLTLADKQVTNRLLLASGLDIRTMNAVRRRLSAVKGGKLAAAARPARVLTLAISDIPGDDTAAIASGPTVVDPAAEELPWDAIVTRLGPALPARVANLLRARPKASPAPTHGKVILVAKPAASLQAAAELARQHGITPVILGDDIEGESRKVAQAMARGIAPVASPTVFISGGETTVTLGSSGGGRGGRNTEFALALACELKGAADVWALAADTDGEDGINLGAAGAIVSPGTLDKARTLGLNPLDCLERHDSGSFFKALGDLVVTGPTRTNVNDFRAILALPKNAKL
ncbi:glycerate kinase type-2 family protein [Novosphingobium sp. M1R2S20]|uniref:Glycerate kinase n=1 Tax=Novosphingobium rhizovicinum TaxID=3228928 RepID=A0ABV3REX7_9SPHN